MHFKKYVFTYFVRKAGCSLIIFLIIPCGFKDGDGINQADNLGLSKM